jgi:hypothetical protein
MPPSLPPASYPSRSHSSTNSASLLLATKRVAWLAAFRVLRGRSVLYLSASPGLVPPVPLNLTEENENEELRCLRGLLLESRAIKLPFHPLAQLCARLWPSGVLTPPVCPSQPTTSRTIHVNPAVLSALARLSTRGKLILLASLLRVLLGSKHPPNCGQVGHRRGSRVPETT